MKAPIAVVMFTVVAGAAVLSAGVDVARAQCKPLCERRCDALRDTCRGQADLQQAVTRSQCQLDERRVRLACNQTFTADLAACMPACSGPAHDQCKHAAQATRGQCFKTAHDAREACTRALEVTHKEAEHACDAPRDTCRKMCK